MSMKKLIQKESGEIQDSFKWRDRQGEFHYPKDMTTKHVFFTLRMIWNHTVPEEMQIEPFQRYNFSSFYTSEYMATAVKNLISELTLRDDLAPYFLRCLRHMERCVNRSGEVPKQITDREVINED